MRKICLILIFNSIACTVYASEKIEEKNSFHTENKNLIPQTIFESKPNFKTDDIMNWKGNIELSKKNELILNKNEMLSKSIEDWAKYNNIDFIWNSRKDIIVFNEIKIVGDTKIQIMEKLGKHLSYQKGGFYLKFYEKNNVLVIEN